MSAEQRLAKREAMLASAIRVHDLRYGDAHCDRRYIMSCDKLPGIIMELPADAAGRVVTAADAVRQRLNEISDRSRHARRSISASLIAVSDRLQTPYSDKPELTPWTYTVRPSLDMVTSSLGDDVPALVAALTEVLNRHQPEPVYEICVHADGRSHAWETADGDWVCGDPIGEVCASCRDEDGGQLDWPCDEFAKVAAALGVSS